MVPVLEEFRYLRTVHLRYTDRQAYAPSVRPRSTSGPSVSPQRSDHLIISLNRRLPCYSADAWRMVSGDSLLRRAFPADCPHLTDCHCSQLERVPEDTPGFPAYSQVY